MISNIINNELFQTLVVIPLAVIGFYQVLRGILTVVEDDIINKQLHGWVRKLYITITILGCIVLIFCEKRNGPTAIDHYEEYDSTHYNSQIELEDEYARGFEDGYSEGQSDIDADDIIDMLFWNRNIRHEIFKYVEFEANSYAMENSENDTETAMMIIDSYVNKQPDIFGNTYTYEEFTEAVMTLYMYYEYFYGWHYE